MSVIQFSSSEKKRKIIETNSMQVLFVGVAGEEIETFISILAQCEAYN